MKKTIVDVEKKTYTELYPKGTFDASPRVIAEFLSMGGTSTIFYSSDGGVKGDKGTVNVILHGVCTQYYAPPIYRPASKEIYQYGVRDGPAEYYSSTLFIPRSIERKTEFIKGKETGECIEYYSNGVIKRKSRMKNGKRHGCVEHFSSLGNKKEEGFFIQGKEDGIFTTYDIYRGGIKSVATYSKGLMHGWFIYYDTKVYGFYIEGTLVFQYMNCNNLILVPDKERTVYGEANYSIYTPFRRDLKVLLSSYISKDVTSICIDYTVLYPEQTIMGIKCDPEIDRFHKNN